MAVRSQPRYLFDTVGKFGVDRTIPFFKNIVMASNDPVDGYGERVNLTGSAAIYQTWFNTIEMEKTVMPKKMDWQVRKGLSKDLNFEEREKFVELSTILVSGAGAVTDIDNRRLISASLDRVSGVSKGGELHHGLKSIYAMLSESLGTHVSANTIFARTGNLCKEMWSVVGPTLPQEVRVLVDDINMLNDMSQLTREVLHKQCVLAAILRETEFMKRMLGSVPDDIDQILSPDHDFGYRVSPGWARRLYMSEYYEDTNEMDAMNDVVFGASHNTVMRNIDEKLEDLEIKLMTRVDDEDMMTLIESVNEVDNIEKLKIKVKKLLSEIITDSCTVSEAVLDGDNRVAITPLGCVFSLAGHNHLVSRDDIKEALDLNGEMLASALSITARFGKQAGMLYLSSMKNLYRGATNLGSFDCNHVPNAGKMLEGTGQDIVLDNLLATPDLVSPLVGNWGHALNNLFTRILSHPPEISVYDWVRAFRPLGQHRFSIPLVTWRGGDAYSGTNEVTDAGMLSLRHGVRLVISNSHRKNHGEWPRSLVAKYPDRDFDTTPPILAEMIEWVPKSDGTFDWDATHVKDKRNIINNWELHSTAERINSQTPFQTREVLYMSGRDVPEMVKGIARLTGKGKLPRSTAVLTVKPEQKSEGRQVTMEDCETRRVTSVINNNAVPLLSSLGGSLMAISNATKFSRMDGLVSDLNCLPGKMNFQVMTDFLLFGNNVNAKATKVVYEEIGNYYGQDWVGNWADRLGNQRVFVHHGGSLAWFDNDGLVNGQGMENGVWQLMLGAIPYAASSKLSKDIPGLSQEDVIKLVYFMDDHDFSLTMNIPKKMRLGLRAWQTMIGKKIVKALELRWKPFGLLIQPEKAVVSCGGFILTGSIYNSMGIVPLTAKGMETAIRPCTHRAPTVLDELGNVDAAISSAHMNGGDIKTILMVGYFCSAYIMAKWHPLKLKMETEDLVVRYFAPARLGGMSGVTPATMIPGSSWIPDDERLFVLYYHYSQTTI
jgi:hypothetical protein